MFEKNDKELYKNIRGGVVRFYMFCLQLSHGFY